MAKQTHQFSHVDPPIDTLLIVGFPDGQERHASLTHPRRVDGKVYPVLIDGSCNVLMIRHADDPEGPIWWRCVDDRCYCRGDGRCAS